MSLEINNVILGGNLTKDVVLKNTATGRKVCTFTLANNRTYMQAGQKTQDTSFIDVEVWGKTAENCAKYIHKGSPVVIVGRLKQDRWETDKGEKRSRLKVMANNVQFLDNASRKQDVEGLDVMNDDAGWDE